MVQPMSDLRHDRPRLCEQAAPASAGTVSLASVGVRQPRFLQQDSIDQDAMREELRQGLGSHPASAAPKFLYDSLGSRLFEAITELDEYYPTRTEAAIFEQHAQAMARTIGAGCTLIDIGAGNCAKAARLLPVLQPRGYVAVDISVDFLRSALRDVQAANPLLDVSGVGVDFSRGLTLAPELLGARPLFFYPGSSIGNFTPEQALAFLRRLRGQAGDGGLLVGVDLLKDASRLEAAYDDALGVTAAFNRNLLRHLNRLLGSDFEPSQWHHVAVFNAALSRVEMHLQARCALSVCWPGGERHFDEGERLHTESSYKYTPASFEGLLRDAGFSRTQRWTDARGWFAVFWAQG